MTIFVDDTYVVAPRMSSAPVMTVVGASMVMAAGFIIVGVVTFTGNSPCGATSLVAAVSDPTTLTFIS